MSLLRRATRGAFPAFNNYVTPYSMSYGSMGYSAAAGERVDESSALGISAVMASVSLLADTVASMPLRAFDVINGTRSAMPLPEFIANPDPANSTTFELLHQVVASLALHGNAYLLIDRDRSGRPIGLLPLHPYQMQVLPGEGMTTRRYVHLGNDIDRENILHLRWLTPPQSLVGVSPLVQARTVIGLSLAMDRHLANWYANGATPSSVLSTDKDITLDQARILQATWESTHGRAARRPAVLSDGLKWQPVTVSASDQQLEQMRQQLVTDIARIYRVPSHLIGAKTGDSQTYANVEQASLDFLTHTVQPWLRRIEVALSSIMVGSDIAFDTSSLLRTDALTRARVDQSLVMMGAKSPNEVRQGLGLEPYVGGDVFNQAMAGAITAGGDNPSLGEDADTSAPVMGVLN